MINKKYKNNIFYKTFHKARLLYFKLLIKVPKLIYNLVDHFNISSIKKAIIIFIKKGPIVLFTQIVSRLKTYNKINLINQQYQEWFIKNSLSVNEIIRQKKHQKKFTYLPLISIITPVYNPKKEWLEKCIKSVINQTYDNWELCLADDKSTKKYIKEILTKYSKVTNKIKVVFRKKNGHISQASNSALKVATGEFVAFLDHDDELSPNALFEVVKVLNINKNIDFIYSDEDKLEISGKHVDPYFKPDWSPDMLLSTNYICHLVIIRKKIVDSINGFRIGYEGSQDYDLFLRAIELATTIYHIPKILYSWRKVPGSTATAYSKKNYANQASINTLQDALNRKKIKGTVNNGLIPGTFRIKYNIIDKPLVSIIIPTKDKTKYLKRCVYSILKKTTYDNYEILIVDTGSIEKETQKYYDSIKKIKKISLLNWNKTFNYSSVNNFAVKKSKGEYVLLLNNDTEVITPDWIESMLEHAQRNEIGAVGAKLLYPDKTIQHAGVILGIKGGNIKRGVAGHLQKTVPDISQGIALLNSKDLIKNYSAVTAACLMVSKEKYNEVNGMDKKLRIAFNDVDFNLKLMKKGYLNLYTPYAKLYHYESISVGTPQQGNRNLNEFQKEINIMINKWDKLLLNDPYYNKNLSLENEQDEININKIY